MKNLQRGIRVLTLIALLMMAGIVFAQEATEEATVEAEATEIVTEEMTEEVEATVEAEETEEMTPAPTETPLPTSTPVPTATPLPTATPEPVDGGDATVAGSGVVNPALQSLVNASGSLINYDIATTGSSAGFAQLCAGQADIATSIRPISIEEDTLCRNSGVEYLELLIGYDIMVIVSNVEDDFLACLSNANLDAIFAPSATSSNWSDISFTELLATPGATPEAEATEEAVTLPDMTILLPEDNTLAYETLDGIVSGFGFRADAQVMDAASIIAAVEATPGTIGVVSLEAALAPGVNVFPLSLNLNAGCESPSVLAVEDDTYTAATPLYVYVATASQETLSYFLDFLVDGISAQALIDAGYSPASIETVALNSAIISGDVSARALTAEEITFDIPPGLSGTISVVGASSGFSIARNNADRLTSTQQTLTINNNFAGQAAGIEAFCDGDADILFVNSGADTICDGGVDYVSYDFGQQAVVLVGNAGDDFSTCLTLEQISTIWRATSADTVTQWSNVSDSFPEQDIVLVGLSAGDVSTDIMMAAVSEGASLPVRDDVTETNNDPAYRSTAVGLVPGALSYMSYADYLAVSTNVDNIQLVAIDTGSGCVVPDESTIMDGTYPLSRSTTMLVKQSSLANNHVQALVWSIFDEANISIVDAQDFVGGVASQDMTEFRSDLLADFEAAQQAAFAVPEVTPEAEATAEATEDASDE